MHAHKKPRTPQPPPPALRLRLQWRRGQWRLVKVIHLPSKTLVAADLPVSDKDAPPLHGVWFEAVDGEGRLILRRRVIEPLPVRAEKSIVNPDEFLIDLFMPDQPDIARVRLWANPDPFQPGLKNAGDQPSLLAAFELPDAQAGKDSHQAAR